MSEVLARISRFSLLAFLLSSMLGIGLSLTVSQIIAPLRRLRFVGTALAANCVIVPLIAIGTARLFRLSEPFAIGLLLLGLAPGAPFLPKVVQLARGELALSVGLMALLMAASVVCLPLVLPCLLPDVKVGLWQIARPLLLLMVLPLVIGLVGRARAERVAAQLAPRLNWLSTVSLLILLVAVLIAHWGSVLKTFGSGAIAAGGLFNVLAGLTGRLFGGGGIAMQKVMVLGTGFRNIAAALAVAEEDFEDPQVVVMLVIVALTGILVLLPVTLAWGKFRTSRPARAG
jgi:BASS family bile acid:Na+ symporter